MITDLRIDEKGELEGKLETLPQWDEMYTKAEVVDMLTDLQSDIKEMDSRKYECDFASPWCIDRDVVVEIIQKKINALKGDRRCD